VDFRLLDEAKGSSTNKVQVNNHLEYKYPDFTKVYTDASKTDNNKVGIAFIIIESEVMKSERVSDGLAVYTGELLAILLALNWVEGGRMKKLLIGFDSSSALKSIQQLNSEARLDIILEIAITLQRISRAGKIIYFIWIPAHIGVEGNELADKYAKLAARKIQSSMNVKYSRPKAEIKSNIKSQFKKKWQEEWDRGVGQTSL